MSDLVAHVGETNMNQQQPLSQSRVDERTGNRKSTSIANPSSDDSSTRSIPNIDGSSSNIIRGSGRGNTFRLYPGLIHILQHRQRGLIFTLMFILLCSSSSVSVLSPFISNIFTGQEELTIFLVGWSDTFHFFGMLIGFVLLAIVDTTRNWPKRKKRGDDLSTREMRSTRRKFILSVSLFAAALTSVTFSFVATREMSFLKKFLLTALVRLVWGIFISMQLVSYSMISELLNDSYGLIAFLICSLGLTLGPVLGGILQLFAYNSVFDAVVRSNTIMKWLKDTYPFILIAIFYAIVSIINLALILAFLPVDNMRSRRFKGRRRHLKYPNNNGFSLAGTLYRQLDTEMTEEEEDEECADDEREFEDEENNGRGKYSGSELGLGLIMNRFSLDETTHGKWEKVQQTGVEMEHLTFSGDSNHSSNISNVGSATMKSPLHLETNAPAEDDESSADSDGSSPGSSPSPLLGSEQRISSRKAIPSSPLDVRSPVLASASSDAVRKFSKNGNAKDKANISGGRSNRVMFSGLVTVKVIGNLNIGYSALREPGVSNVSHSSSLVNEETSRGIIPTSPLSTTVLEMSTAPNERFPVFSNGSECFADLREESRSALLQRLIKKRQILNMITIFFLLGMTISASFELFQLWLSVQEFFGVPYSTHPLERGILEGAFGALTVIAAAYFYHKLSHGGMSSSETSARNSSNGSRAHTLFLFRLLLGCYSYLAILRFVCPLLFSDENSVRMLLTSNFLIISSMFATLVLLLEVFLRHSAYNHERRTVCELGHFFWLAGLGAGTLSACLVASLVEYVKDPELGLGFSLGGCNPEWLLVALLSHATRVVSMSLPNKVQRKMREPAEPRYALTMLSGRDQEDEDEEDEEAEEEVANETQEVKEDKESDLRHSSDRKTPMKVDRGRIGGRRLQESTNRSSGQFNPSNRET